MAMSARFSAAARKLMCERFAALNAGFDVVGVMHLQ
jgi:hypothetical protein